MIILPAQFKSKDVSSFLVLKHDHLDKLQYIKCDLNPENYSDPILQNVLARHGDKLTQVIQQTDNIIPEVEILIRFVHY